MRCLPEPLPPVELYKLGCAYYVLDGHHRIAAAMDLGQLAIDASVTEHVPSTGSPVSGASADARCHASLGW